MSHWEFTGQDNHWRTPAYIFSALDTCFDMDVAGPAGTHVPATRFLDRDSLSTAWQGFVWMNPPFGARNGLTPWLERFCAHGNGIALVPDRTSAPWFQTAARQVGSILFVSPKIKFERADGSSGNSPSTGTALLGIGTKAQQAMKTAQANRLGLLVSV